jgi:segregation and condensation protein B
METLAVVAYRQPVLRSEIEAVRGVQSGEVLRQLMERELVRIAGRSHELGRPFLYATTKQFLQAFGLKRLDELPRAETLRNLALPAKINTINDNQNPTSHSQPDEEEEENVKTLIAPRPKTRVASANPTHDAPLHSHDDDSLKPVFNKDDDDDLEDDDFDDDEDLDDEDEDEDIEDEEWEEVEDEDEDWDEDEDEDWDDDWDDDEDDDWDDDEDEEEDDDEE